MQYNQSHAKYVFIEVWNNLIKITATRLERVCGATHRGFESLPLCHHFLKPYFRLSEKIILSECVQSIVLLNGKKQNITCKYPKYFS